jgi:tetratricopeptide (TPR) repeat protein
MKKSLHLVVVFVCANLFAQDREIDSLTNLLVTSYKEQDSTRINILIELGYNYYLKGSDKSLIALDEAIALAKQLELKKHLARAYQYKGHRLSSRGDDSLAMRAYDDAIGIYELLNDKKRKARAIYNKGLVHFNQSNYNQANKNTKEAYLVFEEAKDSVLMAKMLNSIALNYMYMTDYPSALSNFFEAIALHKKIKDTVSISFGAVNANIGLQYIRLEKFDKAVEYNRKALSIYDKNNYKYGVANSLTNIGNAFDYLEKPEEAIENYNKAYGIMSDLDNKYGMASAITNIGIAYITLKDYSKALTYFKQSKPIYESLRNSNNLAIVHDQIGICYLNLKNNVKAAKSNFETSLKYAKQASSLNLQVNALESLTKTYYKLGNYKQAYDLMEEATVLNDSFYSIEKKDELTRLEEKYKYENEKTLLEGEFERERLITKEQVKRQKYITTFTLFGGGGLFLLVVGGMFFYRKKREVEFNLKVADTELKALRAQLDPHFLFNSLNSINSYIIKNDTESATNYLTKFARLIRKTLESSSEKEVILGDDIEVLKNYLDIEQKRLNNNFTYSVEVSEDLDVRNVLIPPLILQPFLENSIWHGVALMENSGHIKLEFKKVDNMLFCAVDDNGVGRHARKKNNKESKSIGINLTKNRIDIINAQMKTRGSMVIIDKEQGVRVEVKLPLKEAF